MKNKSVSIIILSLVVINFACLIYIYNQQKVSPSLNQSTQQVHPTQDEWLKVYISHNVYKITDMWTKRVSVTVDIFTTNPDGTALIPKELIIGITSPNGESIPNENAIQQYITTVKGIAETILKDYRLENDYKLVVQSLF